MKIKNHKGLFRPEFIDRKTGQKVESKTIFGQFVCHGCSKHPNGGTHRESLKTEKIKEADANLTDLKKKYAKPLRHEFDSEKITVKALIENYIATAKTKCKLSTVRNYEDLSKKHLIPDLGNEFALNLIYDDSILTRFTTKKLEGIPPDVPAYSVAHVNAMRTLLKASFSNAHKALSGMMPNIEHLPDHAKRSGFYTDGEIKTLLSKLPSCLVRPIQALNLTGWRLSEIFSRMKAHCIMPVHGIAGKLILESSDTKNSEPRTFPIIAGGELESILREQLETTRQLERKTGSLIQSLFHNDEGQPFMTFYEKRASWKPTREFRSMWKDALKEAGLANRLLHDFRRTQIRRFAASGIDDATGMSLSGHKSLRVYHDYKAVGESDRLAAVEKLQGKTNTVETKTADSKK